jgi:DNA-directed RNA polymerase specialized sigma24 family protein
MHWTRYTKIAESVAQRVAEEYPGIEAEDIRQEILLHVVEKKSTYEATDYPDGQLRKNFRNVAISYAGKERYAYIYYSAEYVYTSPEVRQLFEKAFFQPEMWETAPTKDDGVSVASGGVVVALWDLDRAYSALPVLDAQVIAKRYEQGEPLSSAETMRLSRAIDKIVRTLNNSVVKRGQEKKKHDGPGARFAMTSAHARMVSGDPYDSYREPSHR